MSWLDTTAIARRASILLVYGVAKSAPEPIFVPVGPGWSRLVPVGPGWSRLVPASANTLMSLHPGSISGCFAGAREFHDLAVAGGPEKGYSADAIRCLQQRIADSDALETYWQEHRVRPIRTTSAAKILSD